jgi:chromatin licensing and DNA replication factor 1
MSLDADKIMRWHPRFKLNNIPDIEPAELPKPPNAKKLTTAAEVLEQAMGNLNPRVCILSKLHKHESLLS